jgi:hypothetical protein
MYWIPSCLKTLLTYALTFQVNANASTTNRKRYIVLPEQQLAKSLDITSWEQCLLYLYSYSESSVDCYVPIDTLVHSDNEEAKNGISERGFKGKEILS